MERPATIDLMMGEAYSNLIAYQAQFGELIARHIGVPTEHVLVTAGAHNAIETLRNHLLFTRAWQRSPRVLTLDPDYWRARLSFMACGFEIHTVNIEQRGFAIDEAEILQAVAEQDPDLVYLSLPNNPTGAIFDAATVIAGVDEGRMLMIDATLPRHDMDSGEVIGELFKRFAGRRGVFLLSSASKAYGMAEYRLGWVVGTSAEEIRVLHEENLNNVSAVATREGMERLARGSSIQSDICQAFDHLRQGEELGFYHIVEPPRRVQSGYVLIRLDIPPARAREIFKASGIIALFGSDLGLDEHYVRLEMTEPENVAAFVAALRAYGTPLPIAKEAMG